jgi:hypothetical protein
MPQSVSRVVFKEIVRGDLRKFKAESNDSETGGGARDLRFSPYDKFAAVFGEMFPERVRESRRRAGINTEIEVLKGALTWDDPTTNSPRSKPIYFEPPTDVRPGEGRIPRVHEYPPFQVTVAENEGRVLLLFIQRGDGSVWSAFATENSLRSGQGWDPTVSRGLLACLDAPRHRNHTAQGYLNLRDGSRYCND